MSDELLPETPPPATTPPAATAQQPSANPLDLPEVRAAIASASSAAAEQARNATWKQARETLGKKTSGPAPTTEPQPAPTATAAPTTSLDIARVVMFTSAATQLGIPAKGVEMLLARLDTERPADVSAWVTEQARDFGWSKPATPTSTPPAATAAPAQAPAGAPVTSNGAPSSTATVTDDVPLMQRSASDIDAYRKQHGIVALTDRLLREARDHNGRLRLPR